MAQSNSKPKINPNVGVGGSHSRSISQPTFCLPPLSPSLPHSDSSLNSNSSSKDQSMEEMDVNSRGVVSSFASKNMNLLPPRKGHRRSNSDMVQSSTQLVPISTQGRFGETEEKPKLEEFNTLMDVWEVVKLSVGESSSGGVKRSASDDIAPAPRHYRSVSMDSAFGNRNFADDSPKLLSPMGSQSLVGPLSRSNSMSEKFAGLSLKFGSGEFTEGELKKIMSEERLAEVAITDPKRVKRILANRQSAARSKERKLRYISELEHKLQTFQTETTTLSTQLTVMQNDFTEIKRQNSELRYRIQAMEQQAQLRNALHETLTGEVQRLRLVAQEMREENRTSCYNVPQQISMNRRMYQMEHQQVGKGSNAGPTSSSTPASA